MTKAITSAALDEFLSENPNLVLLMKLEFPSSTLYLNSTSHSINFAGQIWLGAGHVGTISGIEETAELQANGMAATLNAKEFSALALGEKFRGHPASVWLAARDGNDQIIPDPLLIFNGRMDRMPITMGEKVQLACENRLSDWDKINALVFSDAMQKERFPSDRFFEFLNETNEREIKWGAS